jgi:hypothetical protein
MKAQDWNTVTVTLGGIPLQAPPEGPDGFIPIFTTRERAMKWAGGDESVVVQLERKSATRGGWG